MASALSVNALTRLSASQLSTLLTNYQACLNAIATTGQEYEIGGRKFRRPDIDDVVATIDAITLAQAKQAGTAPSRTLARFR